MPQPPYNQPPGGFGPPPGSGGFPPPPSGSGEYSPPSGQGNYPPGPDAYGNYRQPQTYPGQNQVPYIDRGMITTGFDFSGYKIKRYIGIVRGITVRSRSVIGNIGAGFQSLVGGKITIYVELCEKAREEAFELMVQHAAATGANAIIGMRYDANEVADGITEVLAYGTAVVIEPTNPQ